MTYTEALERFSKKKDFPPVVLLHGEEPFFIDRIEDAIERNCLPEHEKSFNQTIFYGKDVEPIGLMDTLRRYPMMAEKSLVILREAADMKGLADLAAYIEKPMPTTVFVICHKHKKLDERTKFFKAFAASKAAVFESKKLYDNQLPDFIVAQLKAKKLSIEPQTALLIAESLGADMAKISNELDKFSLHLTEGSMVSAQLVQDLVGISKDFNVFELQKALAARDVVKANQIGDYFASNPRKNPLVMTVSSLFSFFSKVWLLHFYHGQSDAEAVRGLDLRSEWFLKDYRQAAKNYNYQKSAAIVSILRDFDLRSKGVGVGPSGADDAALTKELIWRILH